MANVSPEFVGFHPFHLVGLDPGQGFARHLCQHPIHHRIVAHAHQPFGRPQAHALKIVRQRARPLRWLDPAMILLATGLVALLAQPALASVAAATIFHHRWAPAMLTFHARTLTRLASKLIPNEQSRNLQLKPGTRCGTQYF